MAVDGVNNLATGLPIPNRALVDSNGNAVDPATEGLPATQLTPADSEMINASVRVEGTSVNGVALAASSTPYKYATVTARKKVTDIDKASIANVGTIWIGTSATDMSGATPLDPGQSMPLFPNGNLTSWFLIVESANDGVSIAIHA